MTRLNSLLSVHALASRAKRMTLHLFQPLRERSEQYNKRGAAFSSEAVGEVRGERAKRAQEATEVKERRGERRKEEK